MVAFYNIESEIHEKAKQEVVDLVDDDPSEDNDDNQSGGGSQNEDGNQDRDRSPVDKGPVFDLDGDIDLESPFLQGMLSDMQIPPTPERYTTPVAAVGSTSTEIMDCESTEDEWENM